MYPVRCLCFISFNSLVHLQKRWDLHMTIDNQHTCTLYYVLSPFFFSFVRCLLNFILMGHKTSPDFHNMEFRGNSLLFVFLYQ